MKIENEEEGFNNKMHAEPATWACFRTQLENACNCTRRSSESWSSIHYVRNSASSVKCTEPRLKKGDEIDGGDLPETWH